MCQIKKEKPEKANVHRVTLRNAVMPSGAWGLFTRQQVRSKTRFSLETRGGRPGLRWPGRPRLRPTLGLWAPLRIS